MKRIILLLVSIWIISMPVYAQQEILYKIDFDLKTNKVSLYALFDTQEEKCVKLIVLKPGNVFDNIDDGTFFFNENVCHADQLYTSEGVIQTDFKLEGGYGLYSARLKDDKMHEFSFYVSEAAELKDALLKLNGDETAIKSLLENGAEKIGVYLYKQLSEEAKNNVIKSIVKETFDTGTNDEQVFLYAEAAKDFINAEIASNIIADSKTTDEVKKYIKIYGNEVGIKTEDLFSLLDENAQNDICNALMNETISTAQALKNVFNSNTSFKVIEKLPYGYVEEALKVFSTLDYSYYNRLRDKNKVLKGISGNVYDCEETLKKAFEKLSEEAYKTENRVGVSNGGSGSGSGGGSGSIVHKAVGNKQISDTVKSISATTFADIGNVIWAAEAIEALHREGIISGRSNDIFAPDEFVTRAEFVKMLVLAVKVFSNDSKCEFDDIKENEWFYGYVASAYENKLIQGDDANRFNPDVNISREDIATILHRAVITKGQELAKDSEYSEFADSDMISDYAQEAIKELKSAGIINGMEDNTFRPKSNATRAQAAVMLWAYLNALR